MKLFPCRISENRDLTKVVSTISASRQSKNAKHAVKNDTHVFYSLFTRTSPNTTGKHRGSRASIILAFVIQIVFLMLLPFTGRSFIYCSSDFHFSYVLTYVLRVNFNNTIIIFLSMSILYFLHVNHLIVFETNRTPFS